LLLLASVIAVLAINSTMGPGFTAFWEKYLGLSLGDADFRMSLLHWVNDGLLTIFFLVVGLEIKREFTVGHLASWRSAALPIAGAIGGMAAPALLYLLVIPSGPWMHGWGVPMATDTAFAVALIVMMGARVPIELRIFLTAAAIVDDIGSIIVVAIFYSGALHVWYLAAALAVVAALALLNRSAVYQTTPYILLGIVLWACVHAGGLHATLGGVVLALFIPTRPPPNLRALVTQANTIITAEAMTIGPRLAGARRHSRSFGIPRRPHAAPGRTAFELCGTAAVRTRQCRRADFNGCAWRPFATDAGDCSRPRDRQTAWHGRRGCPRCLARHRDQARRIFMAAALRRRRACRHRLHHVAVHCRPGVSRRG
jgi:hypothetical protein